MAEGLQRLPPLHVQTGVGNTKSSNPSPSISATNSPTATSATAAPGQIKKRTRASRPKVRTGCITWIDSKIRRVKCGEEKPACLRCTSTGRTCDGYDKGSSSAYARYRSSPADPTRTAELAKVEFVKACQWSEALRSMRRIAPADIDGTDTEKRFFARFRSSSSTWFDPSTPQYLSHYSMFWNKVISPSTNCCQDEAVKHAVVALGAAHTLVQFPNQKVLDGFTRDALDVFVIQQYNNSIEKLQRHVRSAGTDSVKITLICCLAFIFLETVRSNHSVAVTHLVNGLRILQSMPFNVFDCLSDTSIFVWPPLGTAHQRDGLDMPDIIQLFARLEVTSCFFTTAIHPVISEKSYVSRVYDDGSSLQTAEGPIVISDTKEARKMMATFQHDTMAFLYKLSASTIRPEGRQSACLQARARRLGPIISDFFARFGSITPNTPDLYILLLDLLYFKTALFLISRIPALPPKRPPFFPPSLAMNPFLISYTPPTPVPSPSSRTSQPHLSVTSLEQGIMEADDDDEDGDPEQEMEWESLLHDMLSLAKTLTTSPIGQKMRPWSQSNIGSKHRSMSAHSRQQVKISVPVPGAPIPAPPPQQITIKKESSPPVIASAVEEPNNKPLTDTLLSGPLYTIALHTSNLVTKNKAVDLLVENINPASLVSQPPLPTSKQSQGTSPQSTTGSQGQSQSPTPNQSLEAVGGVQNPPLSMKETVKNVIDQERQVIEEGGWAAMINSRGGQGGKWYDAPRALNGGVGVLPRIWDALVPSPAAEADDDGFGPGVGIGDGLVGVSGSFNEGFNDHMRRNRSYSGSQSGSVAGW
ncbi:hypothetical protein QBC40DRAFT_268161 [Triangularia verruculosa]|uniref:Zn(2)-C6 fungal-type domain-containing protein n=1 Tax=Triangularia verruculosa TaxID=2587418 RepID=A0AAN6XB59_9PEZI|nr:hypothetical protein QBC40DRAFT_268161 [Triangularia verruculosa]